MTSKNSIEMLSECEDQECFDCLADMIADYADRDAAAASEAAWDTYEEQMELTYFSDVDGRI